MKKFVWLLLVASVLASGAVLFNAPWKVYVVDDLWAASLVPVMYNNGEIVPITDPVLFDATVKVTMALLKYNNLMFTTPIAMLPPKIAYIIATDNLALHYYIVALNEGWLITAQAQWLAFQSALFQNISASFFFDVAFIVQYLTGEKLLFLVKLSPAFVVVMYITGGV